MVSTPSRCTLTMKTENSWFWRPCSEVSAPKKENPTKRPFKSLVSAHSGLYWPPTHTVPRPSFDQMYDGVLQSCWKTRTRTVMNWVSKEAANSAYAALAALSPATFGGPTSRSRSVLIRSSSSLTRTRSGLALQA